MIWFFVLHWGLLSAGELPTYGIESTITRPAVYDLTPEDLELFRKTRQEVLDGAPLSRMAEISPRSYKVFEQFIDRAFPDGKRPAIHAHKGFLPSYEKTFANGFWLRFQHEFGALEMQARASTIRQFRAQSKRIDEEFFLRGRRLHLTPRRAWGMGHIHEGLVRGYPDARPEIWRNRIVEQLNRSYFWSLVGPKIDADMHWENAGDERIRAFETFLASFDDWIFRFANATSSHDRIELKKSIRQFAETEEFSSNIFPETLKHIQLLWSLALTDDVAARVSEAARFSGTDDGDLQFKLQRVWFGRLLKLLFQQAFTNLSDNRTGWAFMMRLQASDLDYNPTLEFRRIPAHANAAEAILWMRLLQGHWRKAFNEKTLIELKRPNRPKGREEKLEVFEDFIRSARMNPASFVKFLTPSLAQKCAYRLRTPP